MHATQASAHEYGPAAGPNHGAWGGIGQYANSGEDSINGVIATFTQPSIESFDVPVTCGGGGRYAAVYPGSCSIIGANARPMQLGAIEPYSSFLARYFTGMGVYAGCASGNCTGIGTNGAPYKRIYVDGFDERSTRIYQYDYNIVSANTSHSIQMQREYRNGAFYWAYYYDGALLLLSSQNGTSIRWGEVLLGTESSDNYDTPLAKTWPGWRDIRRKYPNGSYFSYSAVPAAASSPHFGCSIYASGGAFVGSGRC